MNGVYLDIADSTVVEYFAPELQRSFPDEARVPREARGGVAGHDRAAHDRIIRFLEHPWARESVRSLVLRDERGNYLSYLQLHAMHALHFDREVWVAGISRLVTPERLRGQGFASTLLRLTLELLVQEEIDGACLWSTSAGKIFEPLGFRPVAKVGVDAPLDSIPEDAGVTAGRVTIRPIQSADWNSISAIYHRAGADQPLWFLRDRDRWDYLLSRWMEEGDENRLLGTVALIGDEIVGYVLSHADPHALRLLEFGMEQPDREILLALMGSLRAAAEEMGCVRVVAAWPPGTWGALFDTFFEPVPMREGILFLASPKSRIDIPAIARAEGGYWELDRI